MDMIPNSRINFKIKLKLLKSLEVLAFVSFTQNKIGGAITVSKL